jgi:hypothetical protein
MGCFDSIRRDRITIIRFIGAAKQCGAERREMPEKTQIF